MDNDPRRRALEGNVRRFILFRLFYSARFYYPVFTVLFLDYGLTLEQFSILNIVWALTIVGAEVPSGALADTVGRKSLVVFAAVAMVVEMSLILFAPMDSPRLLFLMFLGNRICSGLSEAAASGADEALAYDSLKALEREQDWSALLERNAQVVAVGFSTAMIVGAFAYDPDIVNRVLGLFSPSWSLSETQVIRMPVALTLLSSILCLLFVLGLHDIDREPGRSKLKHAQGAGGWSALVEAFRQIRTAAVWTLDHRQVLFVILAALALDSVGRQFVILASEYWRAIDIPVSWFGFIGAALSLMGIVNARISRYLVNEHSPFINFLVLSAILMTGLIGLVFAIPYWGALFAVGAFAMMSMVQYQSSYYINHAVDSTRRATVLSFKGLALNLGLGLASLLYTALVSGLRATEGLDSEEKVFVASLAAFPFYYLLLFALLIVLGRALIGDRSRLFSKP